MWLERLKDMKSTRGLTTKEIADGSGIPEPTLEKLFAGVTKEPKLGTMITLVHFLGYTLDDLDDLPAPAELLQMREDLEHPEHMLFELSYEGKKIGLDYDKLDARGKKTVRALMDYELSLLKPDK